MYSDWIAVLLIGALASLPIVLLDILESIGTFVGSHLLLIRGLPSLSFLIDGIFITIYLVQAWWMGSHVHGEKAKAWTHV